MKIVEKFLRRVRSSALRFDGVLGQWERVVCGWLLSGQMWLACKIFLSRVVRFVLQIRCLYDVEDHLFVCVTKSEVVTNEEYARVVFELGETSLASCGAPLL